VDALFMEVSGWLRVVAMGVLEWSGNPAGIKANTENYS